MSSRVVWFDGLSFSTVSVTSSVVEVRSPLNVSTLALSSSTFNVNVNGSGMALRVPSSLTVSSSSTLITSSLAAGTVDIDATSTLASTGTTTGELRVEAQQLSCGVLVVEHTGADAMLKTAFLDVASRVAHAGIELKIDGTPLGAANVTGGLCKL